MTPNIHSSLIMTAIVKIDGIGSENLFINGYWCEMVKFRGEAKERYKFLPGESELRMFYEEMMCKYSLVDKVVRFFDINDVNESKKKSIEKYDNQMKFIGLKENNGITRKKKEDGKTNKSSRMYMNRVAA